jgi:hypothetical protein
MVKQILPEPYHYLGRESLVELRNGWLFANHIGYPLNTMLTINWRSAEGFVAKAWKDNKKVEDDAFHSLQTFYGERHLPLAYIYAMENLECSATIWMKAGGDQDECRDRAGGA